MLEGMSKEEIQQIADGLQLEELMENPSQDKKRWTQDEDIALQQAVEELGTSNWGEISRRMPARRSSIQCRRRYSNKLDPNVKNDDWTEDEDKKIVAAQSKLGNRWAQISKMLDGRCVAFSLTNLSPFSSACPLSFYETRLCTVPSPAAPLTAHKQRAQI